MGMIVSQSDYSSDKQPKEKNSNVLVGDVTTKQEKKLEREMKIKEKQLIRTSKAEEMSGKIMEEKERLSLGTRSRGTSRATSRTGSPTPNARKQVHFKSDDVRLMKSSLDSTSSSSSQNGFSAGAVNRPAKSLLKNQNGQTTNVVQVKPSDNSEDNVTQSSHSQHTDSSESTNNNVSKAGDNGESQGTEIGQRSEKLSTIDERANSRCSNKSEDVKKG